MESTRCNSPSPSTIQQHSGGLAPRLQQYALMFLPHHLEVLGLPEEGAGPHRRQDHEDADAGSSRTPSCQVEEVPRTSTEDYHQCIYMIIVFYLPTNITVTSVFK